MNEQLLQRLDALAAKLGTTAQQLWDVLMSQAKVQAITDVVWIALCGVATWLILKAGLKLARRNSYDDEGWWAGLLTISVVCAIGDGFAVAAIMELPTLLLNPKFWALSQILGQVHQ